MEWQSIVYNFLKKSINNITSQTLYERLPNILFMYRMTPQSTTGKTSAVLTFGRPI